MRKTEDMTDICEMDSELQKQKLPSCITRGGKKSPKGALIRLRA
jgi:hypothetical protein